MNWIDINKQLRQLWSKAKSTDAFIEAAMGKYKWSRRQCLQNASFVIRENGKRPPRVEEKVISRRS